MNKSDAGKDLETQREVVISMLLRLLQHYQVFSIIIIFVTAMAHYHLPTYNRELYFFATVKEITERNKSKRNNQLSRICCFALLLF